MPGDAGKNTTERYKQDDKDERHDTAGEVRATISQQIHYLPGSANILITPSAAFANKKRNVYKDLIQENSSHILMTGSAPESKSDTDERRTYFTYGIKYDK